MVVKRGQCRKIVEPKERSPREIIRRGKQVAFKVVVTSNANCPLEESFNFMPWPLNTTGEQSRLQAIFREGNRCAVILGAVTDGFLKGLKLVGAPKILSPLLLHLALGPCADAECVDGDIKAVVVEDAFEKPGPVKNGDGNLVLRQKLVLNRNAVLGRYELVCDEIDAGIATTCPGDAGNVRPDLAAPVFLGAERERPSLVSTGKIWDVPSAGNFSRDGIGLRIGFAVAAADRAGLRTQVRRDEFFGKALREVFKLRFVFLVSQGLKMMGEHFARDRALGRGHGV